MNTVLEINGVLLSTPQAIITIKPHYGQHECRLTFCGCPCSRGKVHKILLNDDGSKKKKKKAGMKGGLVGNETK